MTIVVTRFPDYHPLLYHHRLALRARSDCRAGRAADGPADDGTIPAANSRSHRGASAATDSAANHGAAIDRKYRCRQDHSCESYAHEIFLHMYSFHSVID